MNKRVNSVLQEVLVRLREQDEDGVDSDDKPYGPGVDADIGGASAREAEAGAGGAVNPSDVGDTLDIYLSDIASILEIEYDMDDEDALQFVFSAADEMADEGLLPEMPEDEAEDEEIALWLGTAKTARFGSYVVAKAREMAAEE